MQMCNYSNEEDRESKFEQFVIAIEHGDLSEMSLHYRNGFMERWNAAGWTPVQIAAITGNVTILQWLFDRGANIEAEDINQLRPLHFACLFNREDAVRYLVECAGSIIDVYDAGCSAVPYGRSPADVAKQWGHDGCVRILSELEASRKIGEFQIYHLKTFSIVSRKFPVFDIQAATRQVLSNVPPVNRPLFIFPFVNITNFLPSSHFLLELKSLDFIYREFLIVGEEESDESIKSLINSLRIWKVQFSCDGWKPDGHFSEIILDIAPSIVELTWKDHSSVAFHLHTEMIPNRKETVHMIVPLDANCLDLKTAFIDYLRLFYSCRIRMLMVLDESNQSDILDNLKRFLLIRRKLFTFYNEEKYKLINSYSLKQSLISESVAVVNVVQNCRDVVKLSHQSKKDECSFDKEMILEFLSKESIFAKSVTDEYTNVVLLREHYGTVDDIRQSILPFVNGKGRTALICDEVIITDNTPIDTIDEFVYFTFIQKYEGITQAGYLGGLGFEMSYQCRMENSDKIFAMKLINVGNKDLPENSIEVREYFLISARVGSHPRIMKFLQFYENDFVFYILMPRMTESLYTHVKNNHPMTEEKILFFAIQILDALDYMHDHKIMHRNVRGRSVALDESGFALLSDFGVSKLVNFDTGVIMDLFDANQTGSYNWMAPEMIDGKCGLKSDIWSFGATIVEMITGRRPFPDMIPTAVILRLAHIRKIEYIHREPLSEELRHLVSICLNPNPEDRPTCKTLLKHDIFKKNDYRGFLRNTVTVDYPP